jgi:hypothetical protein
LRILFLEIFSDKTSGKKYKKGRLCKLRDGYFL